MHNETLSDIQNEIETSVLAQGAQTVLAFTAADLLAIRRFLNFATTSALDPVTGEPLPESEAAAAMLANLVRRAELDGDQAFVATAQALPATANVVVLGTLAYLDGVVDLIQDSFGVVGTLAPNTDLTMADVSCSAFMALAIAAEEEAEEAAPTIVCGINCGCVLAALDEKAAEVVRIQESVASILN